MLTINSEQLTIDVNNTTFVTDCAAYLLQRIKSRQASVAVIGLGYVGLPLAVSYAEAGFHVTGLDIDVKRVDVLNAGRSPIADVPSVRLLSLLAETPPKSSGFLTLSEETVSTVKPQGKNGNGHAKGNGHVNGQSLTTVQHEPEVNLPGDAAPVLPARGTFRATTDYDVLFDVDAVIICVPTPLSSTKDPDMSFIIAAADEIARRLHSGMLVVLESTTYPGTTEEILLSRLHRVKVERASLQVGKDFFLAYSPERIDPGRTDWTVRTTPKVLGGTTPACLEVAKALYESAIETVVPVSKTQTAEMVKLLENTFRAVNIALVNEVAIMCDRLGVDVWEVIDAAKTKPFGYMAFYPGPGLGGHCIPIDPHYLAWKLKTLNYNARFIELAEEINFGMPHHVLGKISDALNEDSKPLRGSRVLVLGAAYKADVGDLRESPTLDLLHLLREKGADVSYNDPYVPRLNLDGVMMTGVPLTVESLRAADCVVICTPHSSYNWQWVLENTRLVIDTRNATGRTPAGSARVVKL
jgi:UDP-N-acetyl-D-glucosamine dehydrogenase